ncbi:MAG TPA: NADH-quinone oxidoreductase subunit L, partial [Nitrospirales bacterium]|nr:NADH-quinone oxidoreductase subunit L [Nitrospirales bacterium]
WTFVIGSLALAGFPGTAGFFSKDDILVSAWMAGSLGKLLSLLGLATAFLTAFYSFRLVFVAFWGGRHHDAGHGHEPIHEPGSVVTVPLMVLAILSIAAGYIGIPEFLQPVFTSPAGAASHADLPHGGPMATVIMLAASVLGLAGIALAYLFYVAEPQLPDRLAQSWRRLYELSFHKWFVDELYDRTIVRPTFRLADRLWRRVDVAVIDGAVNGTARAIAWWAWFMRLVQSGQTQHYALGMMVGAVLMLTIYLFF